MDSGWNKRAARWARLRRVAQFSAALVAFSESHNAAVASHFDQRGEFVQTIQGSSRETKNLTFVPKKALLKPVQFPGNISPRPVFGEGSLVS